jgi:hypothetical protein
MIRFYHALSGLATHRERPDWLRYRIFPGGEAGCLLRGQHWFGPWFNRRAVCGEMVRTASFGGTTGLGRHRSHRMSQGLRQTAGGAEDRDRPDGPTSRQVSDQGASKERVYGVVLIFSTLGRS